MDNVTHESSIENTGPENWTKGKVIRERIPYNQKRIYGDHEIEQALRIPQNQLNNAKLFSSRYDYAKTLGKGISYLELGVAWGRSAEKFINITEAKSADLVDLYNNAYATREPGGSAPKNSLVTHEQHIKDKFSYHPGVNVIQGDAIEVVPTLTNKYDLIFIDLGSERFFIRNLLRHCSRLVNVGGVIGLTSYMNYDAIHYEEHVGTYQSVNEFLYYNKNWSVDAMVLHELGFHEIYIKKNS